MRSMSGTKLAVTIAGATALTTAATVTAYAHDGGTGPATTTTSWPAPTLDRRVPFNAAVYQEFLDAKLDRLQAYVAIVRAKVGAVPADEVLAGLERRVAKARIAKAARVSALLGAVPDSGTYAPTAAQQAQIADIRADLAAIVAKLKALLANVPTVAPTTVRPAKTTRSLRDATKVLGATWDRDHDCDRHWGGWDGDRDGDGDRRWGDWSGDRDWDRR
jgi:hypothetical protein